MLCVEDTTMIDKIPDGRREKFNPYEFFGGAQWWDNYAEYSPEDSELWLKLFEHANSDLRACLMHCRNTGAKLIPDQNYGYIIQPVIGLNGWTSQDEYNQERKILMKWKNEIIKLLGGLR